uniref:Tail protein n=1 Tax=Dulem virus 34 TaxID=3145752 RepID=A0AAU8B575_9CAUD
MRTRRAEVELTYNGAAVTTKMAPYQTEVAYTDPASGEADSLDISIHDRETQWTTAWVPITGDTLSATIKALDWTQEGDNRVLPCGFFVLDSYSFSGWPLVGVISSVSVPADGAFMATERTKTWENVTIQEIGKEIAARAGIELAWDVEGEPFTIKSVEQSEQTDCDFYMSLCDTYGLAMKVYAQKIVVYDREAYKAKDAVGKITEEDLESWSWSKNMAGTYTGGEYTYTDPATEEEIKVTVGTGTRILKMSGKADSQADAERKIQAAVNKANHGAAQITATIMGNASMVASQCVTVVGLGKLSGKYYIDSITHRVSGDGGYTMEMEMSLVEAMTEEVIKDATQRLAAVGVMASPDYWVAHYQDVGSLDGLILNMATRIKVNQGGNSISNVTDALTVLTNAGVINSPDYWAAKYTAVAWLDVLLISAANALTT